MKRLSIKLLFAIANDFDCYICKAHLLKANLKPGN